LSPREKGLLLNFDWDKERFFAARRKKKAKKGKRFEEEREEYEHNPPL